ncbi:MAG: hypothetical protein WCI49_09475 [Ferruginibacter sp.]
MKILMLPLMAGMICSCNNQEELPAGGPCTYDTTVNPAKLINLVQKDSLNYDALFEIAWQKAPDTKDTISYYLENLRWLTSDQIKNDSLAVGKTYRFVEYNIRSGSCNGHIQSLVLTPFTSVKP